MVISHLLCSLVACNPKIEIYDMTCTLWIHGFVYHPVVCVRSYPYSEDSSQGKQYMNTRCPAWCDRILMSSSAKDLVVKVSPALIKSSFTQLHSDIPKPQNI